MEMAKKNCGDCRWWIAPKPGIYKRGDCRRHAPAPGAQPNYLWPRTRAADWCGDYKAKPKEKLTENGG